MQNNWKVYIVLLLMKIEKLSNSGHCWYTRDQFTLLIYLSSHCWSTWVQFTLLVFLSSVCTADLFEISSLCWSPWVQFYQGWSCLNSSSSLALSLLLLNFSDFFPMYNFPFVSSSSWGLTKSCRDRDNSQNYTSLDFQCVLQSLPYASLFP